MTTIIRVQFSTFTSTGVHHNQVKHFEADGVGSQYERSAREVATAFIHGLWLDKLVAQRDKGRKDYTVHQVLEIDVEAGTSEPLWWEEPEPMMLRDHGISEVHIIMTADGSYDWTTDPDTFGQFEKEVLDDGRERGPVIWHAFVEMPGWMEGDGFSDLAQDIVYYFVHRPRELGEHVDLLGPWRDAQD